MKEILKSWLFFTSLLLLIFAASLVVPELMHTAFGNTNAQLELMAENMQEEAIAAWAEISDR